MAPFPRRLYLHTHNIAWKPERKRIAKGQGAEYLDFRRYVESEESSELADAIHQYANDTSLPVAFQNAIVRADQYSDRLHEDAQRSVKLAQQQSLYEQKNRQLSGLNTDLEAIQGQIKDWHRAWQDRLNEHGFVEKHMPAGLKQWQQMRVNALVLDGDKSEKEKDLFNLRQEIGASVKRLNDSLNAAGEAPQSQKLPELINQAEGWLHAQAKSEGARSEKVRNAEKRKQRRKVLEGDIDALTKKVETETNRLTKWKSALNLNEEASVGVLQTRLNEFNKLKAIQEQIWELDGKVHEEKAIVANYQASCMSLADQLHETPGDDLAAWVDRIADRLATALAAEQKKEQLEGEKRREKTQLKIEIGNLQEQQSKLDTLLHNAGVTTPEKLMEIEEAAQRRRALKSQLTDAEELLHQSNPGRTEEDLRESAGSADEAALVTRISELEGRVGTLEGSIEVAEERWRLAARELEEIDTSDQAASIQEEINALRARILDAFGTWSRLQVAGALLNQALVRYREQAQGPMIKAASEFFSTITDGRYRELVADEEGEHMVLLAKTPDDDLINVSQMSEGTADQLYLALRLAALKNRDSSSGFMPLVLDDVAMTSDDHRAACMLRALDQFGDSGQILLYTHHRHLLDIASQTLSPDRFQIHKL